MKWLKRILVQMAIGANVMAALLLLACGLCSGLNPAEYPRAAIFVLGFPLLLLLNLAFVFFWLVFSIRHVWIPFAGMLFSVSYIYDYCPVNWPSGIPPLSWSCTTVNFAHKPTEPVARTVLWGPTRCIKTNAPEKTDS